MKVRPLVTAAAAAILAVLLAGQVRRLAEDPTVWPPDDFVEYWAAARLALAGENPYDPALLLPLQRAAGRDTDEAVMMWNPPWSLPAVLPLGLMHPRAAQFAWLLLHFAAVGWCGDRLWRLYGGSPDRRWVGWVLALGFVPTLFAFQSGQIGPLLLLGAVLFLECTRRGWPMLAGAATVLLAVKPHLAYLVWVAIAVGAIAQREWRVLAGGAAAGLAATLAPLAFNPHLLAQYADAMANRPPAQWVSPTLGGLVRVTLGEGHFRLQFLPVAAGLAWFAWHWRRTPHWDWAEQTPPLLLVSFITAPYGAWPFDLVLLVPAVVQVAVRRAGSPSVPQYLDPFLVGFLALNAGCLALNAAGAWSFWFLWVAPALLVLHTFGMRPAGTHTLPPCPAPGVVAP